MSHEPGGVPCYAVCGERRIERGPIDGIVVGKVLLPFNYPSGTAFKPMSARKSRKRAVSWQHMVDDPSRLALLSPGEGER
jgi:hypothetical protein